MRWAACDWIVTEFKLADERFELLIRRISHAEHHAADGIQLTLKCGRNRFSRCRRTQSGENQAFEIRIPTVEDAIFSKPASYRMTNTTSERQWDDVTRLLKQPGDAWSARFLNLPSSGVALFTRYIPALDR